jgi:chromosome segregation ATPase
MQDEKRDYFADIIEDAEAALEDHVDGCTALRERFDNLKPKIQEVTRSGPEVEENENPLAAMKARRDGFETLSEEAEWLRETVADLKRELEALGHGLSPGAGSALDPLQDLDPFADDEELLSEAHRVLERYELVRRTRLNPLAATLEKTEAQLSDTSDAYAEEAASIDEAIQSLRADTAET